MAKIKLLEYKSFYRMIEKLLLIAGLWPVLAPSKFYRALPYLNMIICALVICFIMNFTWLNLANLNVMSRGLSLGTSFMNTILKIMCVTFNYNDMVELHETLQPIFNELLNDQNICQLILQKLPKIRRLSTVMKNLIGLSILTFSVHPWVFIIQSHFHDELVNGTEDTSAHLKALPAEYPWNIDAPGFFFICQYTLEIYAGFTLFAVTSGVDSLFLFYIFQMMGKLRAMALLLDRLKSQDNYTKVIGDCVAEYQKLMRCRDILELIYGPIILWMLLTGAVVLCTLTFQISQAEQLTVGGVLLFIAYAGSKMLQTFLYAWGGSLLTIESENLEESIYSTDWPGSGKQDFMTSILIMLSQRPLVLTACSYTVVSVDMFAMVINTTVSYFFLLQTMQEKNH